MTNTLYTTTRKVCIMPLKVTILWALAIIGVALLNVLDVLPDGATIVAILTLPAMAAVRARKGHC